MKKTFKSIISSFLALALIFTLFATNITVYATADNVQQKINQIKAVYPTGSYFTSTGKSHAAGGANCPSDCNVCKLQSIPARGNLPSGSSTNASGKRWQCYAFASYAAYVIFGDANVKNWEQVSISKAKVGDIVYFGFNHWGVFLYTEGNNVVVYDANYDYNCRVRYGSKYAKSKVSKIYHSPNYDKINGSFTYTSIETGQYYIKSKHNSRYLNVAYGKDADKTEIHTYSFGNWDSQIYNITEAGNGYKVRPACSSSRLVNPYADTVTSGKAINLYHDTNESSQWWKFQSVSGGYIIRNVQNPNVCLTVDSSSDALTVQTYTGANNQIWILEKRVSLSFNANGGSNAPSKQYERAGRYITLPSKKPTKDGCTFLGWSKSKTAVKASYSANSSFKLSGNTTLYAVWQYAKCNHSWQAATCDKVKICTICGIASGSTLGHRYSSVCDTTCNTCGKIRKITHPCETIATKATFSKNGTAVEICTACHTVVSTTTINAIKTVDLTATAYTYNGKAKKPSVIVKDSAGKTVSSKNYTITYAKGRKNVGTYKVTVKFKGNYSGSKTLTFKINPPKTTVKKLTAAKKSLKVAITKKTTQVTGYQVQYSTSKKFTKATTQTVKSYKTTSCTIKKLSAKKTYYVRVRTYKTVNGKKYYSGWSTVKYKKTK